MRAAPAAALVIKVNEGGTDASDKAEDGIARGRDGARASGDGAPAQAADKQLTILATMPDMAFPFFVHMMKALKGEADKLGDITIVVRRPEQHAKQTADIEAAMAEGQRHRDQPEGSRRHGAGAQSAVDASIPVVTIDRRVERA